MSYTIKSIDDGLIIRDNIPGLGIFISLNSLKAIARQYRKIRADNPDMEHKNISMTGTLTTETPGELSIYSFTQTTSILKEILGFEIISTRSLFDAILAKADKIEPILSAPAKLTHRNSHGCNTCGGSPWKPQKPFQNT